MAFNANSLGSSNSSKRLRSRVTYVDYSSDDDAFGSSDDDDLYTPKKKYSYKKKTVTGSSLPSKPRGRPPKNAVSKDVKNTDDSDDLEDFEDSKGSKDEKANCADSFRLDGTVQMLEAKITTLQNENEQLRMEQNILSLQWFEEQEKLQARIQELEAKLVAAKADVRFQPPINPIALQTPYAQPLHAENPGQAQEVQLATHQGQFGGQFPNTMYHQPAQWHPDPFAQFNQYVAQLNGLYGQGQQFGFNN